VPFLVLVEARDLTFHGDSPRSLSRSRKRGSPAWPFFVSSITVLTGTRVDRRFLPMPSVVLTCSLFLRTVSASSFYRSHASHASVSRWSSLANSSAFLESKSRKAEANQSSRMAAKSLLTVPWEQPSCLAISHCPLPWT